MSDYPRDVQDAWELSKRHARAPETPMSDPTPPIALLTMTPEHLAHVRARVIPVPGGVGVNIDTVRALIIEIEAQAARVVEQRATIDTLTRERDAARAALRLEETME